MCITRAESLDQGHIAEALEAGGLFPIRKSHDAAVGALVHMLKKAPPLHQDLHTSEHPSRCGEPCLATTPDLRVSLTRHIQEPDHILEAPRPASTMSSEIIATRKTTSDALEEFHGYREMKKLLLMGGSKPQI